MTHEEILNMMECVGNILFHDDTENLVFNFNSNHAKDIRPAVYAWVCDGEILYIGKAGQGVAARMKEHKAGFRRGRGKSHHEFLAPIVRSGKIIEVWSMWPGFIEFEEHKISMHSSIEDWLIASAVPRPPRNRQPARSKKQES